MARPGRNQPCPCGSGKKYKKCCGPRETLALARREEPPTIEWPRFDGTYLRFRVTLLVSRPPIWRTFLLRGDASFADLHEAIQACGWEHAHLWSFTDASGKEIAGPPDDRSQGPVDSMFSDMFGLGGPAPDAETVPLAAHFRKPGDRCLYTYDFGDRWEHEVVLEAREKHEREFPRALIDGQGVFPPEDCGGVPGWERLLVYHETGEDPWGDTETLREWVSPRTFEPFDLDRARQAFGEVLDLPAPAKPERADVRIDDDLVDVLVNRTQDGLEKLLEDVGLHVHVRRAVYNDLSIRLEVELAKVRDDGVVMNKRAQEFLRRCREFGLAPEDLGREIRHSGDALRIVGLRPRAKLAVLCEAVGGPSDTLIAMRADVVRKLLAADPGSRKPGTRRLRLVEGEEG